MEAGGRAGRQGADHRDLVGRCLLDLFASLFDGDDRPAQGGERRELDKLAQHEAEGVQAVTEGDRQEVGAVCLVEHVRVGLHHDVATDRQPDHRG